MTTPRLVGAVVVTDMRVSHALHKQGWVILHHQMEPVPNNPDPSAIRHKFVVLGLPEDVLLDEMDQYTLEFFKDYEQTNDTRD